MKREPKPRPPTLEDIGREQERFWMRVDRSAADGCWPWTAGKNRGYGCLLYGHSVRYAHRIAFELTNGPIPAGMYICHRCDNPPCCNPAHLFAGTPTDNAHDRDAKGRQVSGRSGAPKLTAPQVVEIRSLYAAGGIYQRALAERYGISQPQVSAIINRTGWTHV